MPTPQPQLLGLWAPFWIDPLAFCCHTMPMIALLFMCRCDLWIRRIAFALAFAWAYVVDGACLSRGH